MNGRLIVHLKDEHTMGTWSAFLVLDTDVTDFNAPDGEVSTTLFKNKKFALNKMFQRNASKFALFYV